MANGKIRFGKQSGGELALVIPDGASNTNLVLPESGTVATEAYADGKTTLAQVKAEISTGSNFVTLPTGVIGYGTGSGGTVTQLTSKSTAVTLNKPTGKIITNNATLIATAGVAFSFNNSLLAIGDTMEINCDSVGYRVSACSISTGGCTILLENRTSGSLSEVVILNFTIIRGATS